MTLKPAPCSTFEGIVWHVSVAKLTNRIYTVKCNRCPQIADVLPMKCLSFSP